MAGCCCGMYELIDETELPTIAKLHIIMLWFIICILVIVFVIGYGRLKEKQTLNVPQTVANSLSEGFKLISSKV